MPVQNLETPAAMSEVSAERARVAEINAKLAALDDEQLTLQENVLNFEVDRVAAKKEFEDEVADWRQVSFINLRNIVLGLA
jgi:hypothetical protein